MYMDVHERESGDGAERRNKAAQPDNKIYVGHQGQKRSRRHRGRSLLEGKCRNGLIHIPPLDEGFLNKRKSGCGSLSTAVTALWAFDFITLICLPLLECLAWENAGKCII
jgi:hypothetical protein